MFWNKVLKYLQLLKFILMLKTYKRDFMILYLFIKWLKRPMGKKNTKKKNLQALVSWETFIFRFVATNISFSYLFLSLIFFYICWGLSVHSGITLSLTQMKACNSLFRTDLVVLLAAYHFDRQSKCHWQFVSRDFFLDWSNKCHKPIVGQVPREEAVHRKPIAKEIF